MKPICILAIGDKAVTSELDRAGYKKMGVQVISADNFGEATELLKKNKVDIISVNLDCTTFNTLQTCKYFKDNPPTKKIPVIGTSVRASAKVKKDALNHGVDLFVEQPIPRPYFIEKIKGLLAQNVRSNDRVEFVGKVEFLNGPRPIDVQVIDISPTGILVGVNMAINETIEFTLTLPGFKKPSKLKGQVVRKIAADEKGPERVAIQYVNLDEKIRKKIEEYVRQNKHEGELRYYL